MTAFVPTNNKIAIIVLDGKKKLKYIHEE